MGNGVDICACGHAIHRHELTGTEYARCYAITRAGKVCRCAGGERVVMTVAGPAVGGPAKYFQRQYRVRETDGWYDTFNGALTKIAPEEYVWQIGLCDICGEMPPGDLDFTAYGGVQKSDFDGALILKVVFACSECSSKIETWGDTDEWQ